MTMPTLRLGQTDEVINQWKTKESADFVYYTNAEQDSWLRGFWSEGSNFLRLFKHLDLTNVLEIACGAGRHAAQIVDQCGHLTLLDTSVDAIEASKKRFAGKTNVSYILSESGRDLAGVPDSSLTAVYSYDSMVHFEMDCMFEYLAEIHRVLKPDGQAVLHHSVYDKNPGRSFKENTAWRNFMNAATFKHVAMRLGLVVEDMVTFRWTLPDVSDGLTRLRKPAD